MYEILDLWRIKAYPDHRALLEMIIFMQVTAKNWNGDYTQNQQDALKYGTGLHSMFKCGDVFVFVWATSSFFHLMP